MITGLTEVRGEKRGKLMMPQFKVKFNTHFVYTPSCGAAIRLVIIFTSWLPYQR